MFRIYPFFSSSSTIFTILFSFTFLLAHQVSLFCKSTSARWSWSLYTLFFYDKYIFQHYKFYPNYSAIFTQNFLKLSLCFFIYEKRKKQSYKIQDFRGQEYSLILFFLLISHLHSFLFDNDSCSFIIMYFILMFTLIPMLSTFSLIFFPFISSFTINFSLAYWTFKKLNSLVYFILFFGFAGSLVGIILKINVTLEKTKSNLRAVNYIHTTLSTRTCYFSCVDDDWWGWHISKYFCPSLSNIGRKPYLLEKEAIHHLLLNDTFISNQTKYKNLF